MNAVKNSKPAMGAIVGAVVVAGVMLAACGGQLPLPLGPAVQVEPEAPAEPGAEMAAIETAALQGLEQIGWDTEGFEAEVVKVEGDFANVLIHTANPPGGFTAIMKREAGAWSVVMHGSAFNPTDLEQYGVPLSILETGEQVTTGMPVPGQDVVEVEVNPDPGAASSGCAADAAGGQSFSDEAAGFCLLYPTGFEVTTPEAGVVVIGGPDYGAGPEPLRGFVNITSFEAAGRTAPEISDELVAPFLPDIMIERVDAMLGGERAVEMIGMPGQALTWQVIVVHNDRAYLLVFAPLGEEYGQATVDMEALYQSVMASFAFLP